MISPNLDLDLLRTFNAIIREGSFTRAASRLNCAQSTVSLQVSRLEQVAGNPLFVRLGRGIQLTEAGELLRTYANGLIELNDEAVLRLRRPTVAGSVRLGMLEDFATSLLPRVLHRFAAIHPDVQLEVRSALTAELLRSLGEGDLDMVLARREPGSHEGELVWRERLLWVDGPCPRPPLSMLPLVMFPHGCVYRPHVLKALRESRRQWRIVYTSTSLAGVQAAVQAGIGLTVLAEGTARQDLRVLDETECGLPRLPDTELALYGGMDGGAASAMRSFLTAALNKLSPSKSLGDGAGRHAQRDDASIGTAVTAA